MMTEAKRREIARKFLVENFNSNTFELWRSYESMVPKTNEARAFEVMYAPYISGAKKRMIAVSDSKDEIYKIVDSCFEKERVEMGMPEYETYGKYYVAYD